MKIIHIVRQYHPSIGGMEEVVQSITAHQQEKNGYNPTIVTLDRVFTNTGSRLLSEEVIDGIKVIRLPYFGSSRYPIAMRVLKNISDADLIHVHGVDFFYDYLALLKPFHRWPLVASTHGGYFHTKNQASLKNAYFKTVTRLSSLAYDKIIATSNNDGGIFSKIVRPKNLLVIENGVNINKFSNCGSPKVLPTIIYFGRWSHNKGLMEIINLFRQLVAQKIEWKLIIAGREYDHTVKELMTVLTRYCLTSHVQLVPNPNNVQLISLIAESSYYICLSRHEGFGIAPIEAMSAGLIPILSDIPPFRNLIQNSGLGLLVDLKNISAAAERISALHIATKADYNNRRITLQNFVKRYSWSHIAERYDQVYKAVLGR